MFNVLILFEQSGTVRDAFARAGCRALSVDRDATSSPRGAWDGFIQTHCQSDVFEFLDHDTQHWDIVIAHPSCTYLTNSAAWAFTDGPYHQKVKPDTLVGEARRHARDKALEDVARLWALPHARLVIENPGGCINTRLSYMPQPQWIHPHQFGHDASKKTGLWKRGLPDLVPTCNVAPRIVDGRPRWANQTDSGQNRLSPGDDRWLQRSLTYQGIAEAMATQWINFLNNKEQSV